MKASVFVGASVDGFIARLNGDFDFLPAGGGEPHGYDEFMASVDVLIIGRNTFERVMTFDRWPYSGKRVVVLSSRAIDLSSVPDEKIEVMRGTPAEILERLEGCWWERESPYSASLPMILRCATLRLRPTGAGSSNPSMR